MKRADRRQVRLQQRDKNTGGITRVRPGTDPDLLLYSSLILT